MLKLPVEQLTVPTKVVFNPEEDLAKSLADTKILVFFLTKQICYVFIGKNYFLIILSGCQ